MEEAVVNLIASHPGWAGTKRVLTEIPV